MAQLKITVENICSLCEKQGCKEPCEKWYDCLEGKPVDFGLVGEEGDNYEKT